MSEIRETSLLLYVQPYTDAQKDVVNISGATTSNFITS